MSRRIKITTEKSVLTNKTFMAKATPYQQLDEEAQIKQAIVENEQNEKEKKLLEKELEKPFGKRNKAVVNKYTAANPEVLNGYPADITKGRVTLTAMAPDDSDIPIAQRPDPYYRIVTVKDGSNTLIYRFPVKKETVVDGEEVYKLDGYNVYVNSLGEINLDMSDAGSPYEIVSEFVEGRKELAEPYKVVDGDKTFYNFTFPGFMVKYTREKGSENTEVGEKKEKKKKLQKATYYKDENPVDQFEEGKSRANATTILDDVVGNGVDVGDVDVVRGGDVIITKMFTGKTPGPKKWLCYDTITDGNINAILLSGVAAAKKFISDNKLGKASDASSIENISRFFEKNNKMIVEKYKALKK